MTLLPALSSFFEFWLSSEVAWMQILVVSLVWSLDCHWILEEGPLNVGIITGIG
jgi:hypothetical protein